MDIILASASPRRKALLEQIGLSFTVFPAVRNEVIKEVEPQDIVVELAEKKASEVFGLSKEGDRLVIAADTIVSYKGIILGKPKDEEDAKNMLFMLSGRTHEVYTGVSLWMQKDGSFKQSNFFEKTKVEMYPISEKDMDAYIASGQPMDKAGAYGIQGMAAKFVCRIEGDYNNVVGLPVARICQEIKNLGVDI